MNEATYCPEDNKLRLYVGRVPREEYLALIEEGWTSTPKQSCDFVAVWSVRREKTALTYADYIGDEDQSPTDRAADRAERFAGYRESRREEATGYADRYEEQPSVHGYQSQAKAERAAARHERIGVNAYTQWEKAEYWQSRTAGVISHALHLCKPSVRMGRIKEIEADMRKHRIEKDKHDTRVDMWENILAIEPIERRNEVLEYMIGESWNKYTHPDTGVIETLYHHHKAGATIEVLRDMYLSINKKNMGPTRFERHCELRLSYENQMLQAAGGMMGEEEMTPGGFLGSYQIYKVNKSTQSGRIVSVGVIVEAVQGWQYMTQNIPGTKYAISTIEVEKMKKGGYRAPTEEEKAAFEVFKKELAAGKKSATKTIPLINPTDECAAELQKVLNAEHRSSVICVGFEDNTPARITQARYSANSGGSYANCEAVEFTEQYRQVWRVRGKAVAAFKVRLQVRGCSGYRVIILTDKPQKPLPALVALKEEVPA
jgi:hypothetical protein